MHWLVADRHGMHALVDALDFSTLTRMHEQSVIDLVTPEAAQDGNAERSAAWATQAGGGTSGAPWRADPRFAGERYVLLDSLRVRPEDLSHDNAAALLAGLERPSEETNAELLAALNWRLRAQELRGLKKIMLAWVARQAKRRRTNGRNANAPADC